MAQIWHAIVESARNIDFAFFRYVLATFVFAHILADFTLRRELICRDNAPPSSPIIPHIFAFVATCLLFCLVVPPCQQIWQLIIYLVLMLSILHIVVDKSLSRLPIWIQPVDFTQRRLFLLEQGLKAVFLVTAAGVAAMADSQSCGGNWDFSRFYLTKVQAYLLGYTFALSFGNAFVSYTLTRIEWNTKPTPTLQTWLKKLVGKDAEINSPEGAGRLIGTLEALLVTTLVISRQYQAVGFVLAAKSIARFEWLKNDQSKAEYFLVGTLANLTCSVFGGMIVLWLT